MEELDNKYDREDNDQSGRKRVVESSNEEVMFTKCNGLEMFRGARRQEDKRNVQRS